MGAFVDALERLITQPRRERRWLPVVLVKRAGDQPLGAGLRGWLGGERRPLTPHAYLAEPDGGRWPLALFDEITAQLARTTRACGGGRLRLPGLWLLKTVAEAEEAVRSGPRHRLRDHLYARHLEESAFARGLWRLAGEERDDGLRGDGGVPAALWNFLVGWAFQSLPRRLFLARARRRLLWFTRWAEGQRGPGPFFDQLRALVPRADEAGRLEDLDRVLVQALVTDLDRAARGRFPRPWRRRRAHRFVVLFDNAGAEHSRVQRFIRELRSEAKEHRATSLLVLAAGVERIGRYLPDVEREGLGQAADWLRQGLRDPALVADVSGLVITLPREDLSADDRATYQLRRRRRLPVRRPRIGPAAELALELAGLAAAAALALLAATAGLLPLPEDDGCLGSTFLGSDGSCVGVRDSAVVDDLEEPVRQVLERIEDENRRVDAVTAELTADGLGAPSRTVISFAPLSGGAGAEDPVRGGVLAQLRGIALAQRYGNDRALDTGEWVPLRVIVADAGDRYRDAVPVARHLVDLAEDDPSIVGVVGMGQSRRTVYEALDVLDAAGLPVVGTAGTADELLGHGRHYYQNAPTNSRTAAAMAAFLRYAEPIAERDGTASRAEQVLLVADARDAYSGSLAESFQAAYDPERTRTLLYSPRNGLPQERDEKLVEGEEQSTRAELARTVCRAVRQEPHTVLVWTARGSEIPLFLRELRALSRDCPRLTLLGGDEVSNIPITNEQPWAEFEGLTLYYALDGGGPLLNAGQEGTEFATRYAAAYESAYEDVRRTLAIDPRPALAWDALRYLSLAVDEAWEATGRVGERLDRTAVQTALYQGLGGFDGASGWFDAPGAGDGGRRTQDRLVLILRAARGEEPRTELACGAVTRDDTRTTWGDGPWPCPGD
ncbi:ABC transporter substrate-binding protein [Streptomyces hoynatensis]|uniref:ABC transporter substrate-binding protein n=2 Tax=Streptomyces hoynatensis TaxID=1141874 RepID=A0A3A9Z5P0_9ACTN|nr:ABC transporter substrate-binding protein [Streptomyces hoynatensis]